MNKILNHFFLISKSPLNGKLYHVETVRPLTLDGAKAWASIILEEVGSESGEVFYSETETLAFTLTV